mmetsp:Transcript_7793/g.8930  ORF Transcript_7793/g.8930 Transcript_7793/m.8930 type:complete len:445 (-) Transcript_7793:316-1650(-)
MSVADSFTTDSYKLKDIVDPGEADVLCGRGGAALRHPGNQTYRRLVHLNKGLYITCLKAEKLKISRSIVAAIREQKGRFLERDTSKGTWFDIGDKKAMEKTSQALREGQPKLRKQIAALGGGAVGAAALLESQFPSGLYNNLGGAGAADTISQRQKLQQHAQMQQQQHLQQQQHNTTFEPNAMDPPPPPYDMSPSIRSPNIRLTDTAIQEEFPMLNQTFRKTSIRGSIDGTNTDQSQLSLMSDYSNFGFESIGTISIPSAPGYTATPSTLASTGSIDRRKYFASIKYSGQTKSTKSRSSHSSNGSSKQLYASNRSMDGMPDIHLVESNPSLYSGMSNTSGNDKNSSDVAQVFESRRSLMSNDRVSTVDGASEHSIFSDLSGKIGNVSTRSMAMSDFSDMSKKITTNTSTRSMALSELSGMDDAIDEIPPLYDFVDTTSADSMDL